MQNPRRLRLAVLAACLAILLGQGVATALLIGRAREAALAASAETLGDVARAVAATINHTLVHVDAILAGLPTMLSPLVSADDGLLDLGSADRLLRELNRQNFTSGDVFLVGPDGTPLAGARPGTLRRDLPPLLSGLARRAARRGGVAIGGPTRDPLTGEWSLYVAHSLDIPGLAVPVTGVAEVPALLIEALLAVAGGSPGQQATLEHADGTLLASLPQVAMGLGQRLSPSAAELARRDHGAAAPAIPARLGDGVVQIAARPTLYPELFVTVARDVEVTLAGWRRDRNRALLASGALALLVAALALALSLALRQREQAEAERARFRRTLENALEAMSDGFAMFDAADRLVVCNGRYRDFYRISGPFLVPGARAEEILREGARRGQHPEAGADIEAWVKNELAWRRGNHPPVERRLPDGRWMLVTERRTPDGGTVGIRTDITALKRAMEELAAARDAADAAGEAKSRFLARMSHELRTPLNGVLGFAQILLDDPRLAPDQRARVRTLYEAGRHVLELVNGLLDLSKIEAGRLDLQQQEVALRPLLEGCATLLRPEVDRKRLDFRLDAPEDLPELVEGDPTRLRQLLLNLLSNAVKFTPAGGRVTLRVRRLAPPPAAEEGLRIEVQDSGPGIPADKRHLLFMEFAQLGGGTEAAGTGLGLAISAQLVALMGGRIGCDSAPGTGALFWVELPLRSVRPGRPATAAATPADAESRPAGPGRPDAGAATEATDGAAAPHRPQRPGESLRVLVVDDIPVNRQVTCAMLEAAGHEAVAVSGGAEAVAAIAREDFDAVLMDVQMPDMDGLEATRRIRALPGPRARVPIIALTASALPDQIEACRRAGMDGHLAKPIERHALVGALGLLARPARPVAARGEAAGAQAGAPSPPAAAGREPPADPGEPPPPLLDERALVSLAADLGPAGRGILAEFVGEIRRAAVVVADALAAGRADLAALRQGAHRLVGAGRTLGARRLVAEAERLQRAAARGETEEAKALQPLVLALADATLAALDARPELAAAEETGGSLADAGDPGPRRA
ncbi:ATP-binding protein [Caldovatus aquaticus]|uniref:histidine kinase n=1 Tax=Caldovatus aquaticus TaxID=2865671 RepID=A0ABS7F787_9PROT|nr:ATP-binding protein [Caldovatus aquaticus]MBW8271479.1 PAS-domain containing protein [Caldovatus aquaticus]